MGPWENWASGGKDRDSATGRDRGQQALDGSQPHVAFGPWAYAYGTQTVSTKTEGTRKLTLVMVATFVLGAVTCQMLALLDVPHEKDIKGRNLCKSYVLNNCALNAPEFCHFGNLVLRQ